MSRGPTMNDRPSIPGLHTGKSLMEQRRGHQLLGGRVRNSPTDTVDFICVSLTITNMQKGGDVEWPSPLQKGWEPLPRAGHFLTFSGCNVRFVSQLKKASLGLRPLVNKETAMCGTSIRPLHLYSLKHTHTRPRPPLWPWLTPFLSLEPDALGFSLGVLCGQCRQTRERSPQHPSTTGLSNRGGLGT